MTWFLVVWVAWVCPGGSWFAPAWPAKLRPVVCSPTARYELYDPARAAKARQRVAALGPDAALYTCRGLACRGPISSWSSVVTYQEATP